MAVNDYEPVLDRAVVQDAVAHWRQSRTERETRSDAAKRGDYMEADTPYRLAARANRLLRDIRSHAPADPAALPQTVRDLIRKGGASPADMENHIFEAVIGESRDFLSVDFLRLGLAAAGAVGRVVVPPRAGQRGQIGTGFLVSPRVAITNHHVLRDAAMATGATFELGLEERDGRPAAPEIFVLRPDTLFLTVKELDFTLVAVTTTSRAGRPIASYGFLPLIGSEGKIAIGEPVNIIQHPGGRAKEVVVRENRLLNMPDDPNWAAHYEADTEHGSSGSPVFNDRWEVIALHHSGVPKTDDQGRWLDTNDQVWEENDDPARIAWIGNEGIRITRLVGAITNEPVPEQAKALRDEVLQAETLKPGIQRETATVVAGAKVEPARTIRSQRADRHGVARLVSKGSTPTPVVPLSGAEALVTLPLTLRVSIGGLAGSVQGTLATPGLSTAAAEALEIDPDYDSREGFDSAFCGFEAPLPEPGSRIEDDLATILEGPDEGAYELRYHHYSVIMNQARRLAFVSAVNVDGDAPAVFEREGSDRWVFDPRIPEDAQAGNEFYAGNPLDRGHLTRRRDAAWGRTDSEAKEGNDDTFHWTNCSPQHEVFNQSDRATRRGLRLWGNLENHVLDGARADRLRLSVFNGPVFRSTDRRHRGLQIPREFFKIIAFRQNGRDQVMAFVLSQGDLIRTLPEEALVEEALAAGPFRPFQVALRDIERRTALIFGAAMHAADTLRDTRGADEAAAAPVPLESFDDLVMRPKA